MKITITPDCWIPQIFPKLCKVTFLKSKTGKAVVKSHGHGQFLFLLFKMLTYFQIKNNKNTLYRIIDYILNDKALVNIFGYNQAVVKSG